VPNGYLLTLLRRPAQTAHDAARLLGVIAEIGRATSTVDDTVINRAQQLLPHAADEMRAAPPTARQTLPNTSFTTCLRCTPRSSPETSTDPRSACSPSTCSG
jgi:hypothetical protein